MAADGDDHLGTGAGDDPALERWAQWARFLARKGLRASQQRDGVVRVFFAIDGHITPADLAERTGGGVGVSTVYRTLALLQEAGLAEAHAFEGQERLYEPTDAQTHHDHLVCRACGRIEEFFHEDLEALQKEVAARMGYELTDHRLDIVGLCEACQREATTTADAG